MRAVVPDNALLVGWKIRVPLHANALADELVDLSVNIFHDKIEDRERSWRVRRRRIHENATVVREADLKTFRPLRDRESEHFCVEILYRANIRCGEATKSSNYIQHVRSVLASNAVSVKLFTSSP